MEHSFTGIVWRIAGRVKSFGGIPPDPSYSTGTIEPSGVDQNDRPKPLPCAAASQ